MIYGRRREMMKMMKILIWRSWVGLFLKLQAWLLFPRSDTPSLLWSIHFWVLELGWFLMTHQCCLVFILILRKSILKGYTERTDPESNIQWGGLWVYGGMEYWQDLLQVQKMSRCIPRPMFQIAYGGKATSGYGRGRRPREMQALWRFNALWNVVDTCSLVFSTRTIWW